MRKLIMAVTVAAALPMAACTAKQEEEGELPNVEVEGGELPKYDVDPAKVEVGTDTSVVVTPDVDIKPATTN